MLADVQSLRHRKNLIVARIAALAGHVTADSRLLYAGGPTQIYRPDLPDTHGLDQPLGQTRDFFIRIVH
jgi:hypothetical protein